MTGVMRRSMMVQALESAFHQSRYAVISSAVEVAVGMAGAGSNFNRECRENVWISFDVTPVALTLKYLTDSVSPHVVVRGTDKEFNMIKFDSGHDGVRGANTVETVIICSELVDRM